MFTLRVDDDVTLELLRLRDARLLFDLHQRNRDRLEPWLPFALAMRSQAGVRGFIESGQERYDAGQGLSVGIWWRRQLAGWAGMRIVEDGYGSIGYWLDSGVEGRGIATKAVRALVGHGFQTLKLPRVEIRCEPENSRSISVAERAGFVREGLLRHAIKVNGNPRDLLLYARVAADALTHQKPRDALPILVRKATAADAEAIAAVFLESAQFHSSLEPERYFVPEPSTIAERYRESRQHPPAHPYEVVTLVAEADGQMVGFVDARLDRPFDAMHRDTLYCYIAEIAVSSPFRSRGAGEQLLRAAEEWARARGAEYAFLEYNRANTRAAKFYADRMGYRVASITAFKRL